MSNNPTFKPSEGKREEFRKYLEKNGVMDALTKVLVSLYEEPEKPEDALEFIRDRLAIQAGIETFNQMKTKLTEYESKIEQMEQEIEELKKSNEPPPSAEEVVEGEDKEAPPVDDQAPPEEPQPEQPAEAETPAAESAPQE